MGMCGANACGASMFIRGLTFGHYHYVPAEQLPHVPYLLPLRFPVSQRAHALSEMLSNKVSIMAVLYILVFVTHWRKGRRKFRKSRCIKNIYFKIAKFSRLASLGLVTTKTSLTEGRWHYQQSKMEKPVCKIFLIRRPPEMPAVSMENVVWISKIFSPHFTRLSYNKNISYKRAPSW